MDYIKKNKDAWENAYEHKHDDFEKDMKKRIIDAPLSYFTDHMVKHLKDIDFKDKTIGQFCTNNGRELLSLASLGVKSARGFDIASNMVINANQMAFDLNLPATFVETNILDINPSLYEEYDLLIITVGALCWFKDLNLFFEIASKSLKKGGVILIEESHPITNMLAASDEDNYLDEYPNLLVNDYFKKTPWVDISGMGYMTKKKMTSTFVSFSHSLNEILEALITHHITIDIFEEYDTCVANLFDHLNHQGIPLSMIIKGWKNQ